MIVAALLFTLLAQDTTGLSPRARAMLNRFPLPRPGEVSIASKFSSDTAWVGEQVELVTAAWFPRELRDRLRHSPSLLPPALSGLWSAQAQTTITMAETRAYGGQLYDLFVAHQTLFPLGGGRITVPPAILTYDVPASASYFAPEQRKTLTSRPVTLVVRAIPSSAAGALGSGPTARGVHLAWRGVGGPIHAGAPSTVQLVLSGEGNIALWPTPEVTWPPGVRVYPERTEEQDTRVGGRLGGEKRFRYTVVADSEGVLSLPRVRYPFFEPGAVQVQVAVTDAVALPVLPGNGVAALRKPWTIRGVDDVPIASQVMTTAWPGVVLVVLLPIGVVWWRRRRRPAAVVARDDAPDVELRRLLGTAGEASPERAVAELRRRGVGRADADVVRRWLDATLRRRYGPTTAAAPVPPTLLGQVVARLRRGLRGSALPLLFVMLGLRALGAQTVAEAAKEYRDENYRGALGLYEAVLARTPTDAAAWRELGATRWILGDDVGASAAWLHALALAPRDAGTREAWRGAGAMPNEIRDRAPVVPLSRDELLLLAAAAWLLVWLTGKWPKLRALCTLLALGTATLGAVRWNQERRHEALLRPGTTVRVSPHPAAPSLGDGPAWAIAEVQRREGDWLLVAVRGGARGWIPATAAAPLGPLD